MQSHSRLSFVICAAMSACASLALGAGRIVRDVLACAYLAVRCWLSETVVIGLVLASTKATDHGRPAVELVQARTYLQRIVKRDGLRYAEAWRMCPLT